MDAQEILKSLSNLEQKLQSIESARLQVEKTVNAYEGAKTQLAVLTQDFKDIYKELNSVLIEIQNSKNIVSTEVSDKADGVFKTLKERSDSLDQATKDIKEKFVKACDKANEDFSNTIEKSKNEFSTEIEANITKVRESSVKEIEKASSIITGFKTAVDGLNEEYKKSLDENTKNHKDILTQIATEFSKSVEQYIVSMRNVKDELESILEKYYSLTTRIEDKLAEVQSRIESALDHLGRAVDTNTQATISLGQKLESKIDGSVSQILEANNKSHKMILLLVAGLILSIILNILAIVKVI
jgi:chaperonin cofactor prefoldin